jgi:hypothetical protein
MKYRPKNDTKNQWNKRSTNPSHIWLKRGGKKVKLIKLEMKKMGDNNEHQEHPGNYQCLL